MQTLQNHASITYQSPGGYLTLRQGIGDFPTDSDWEKVPASAVQQIKIGEYQGEYVNGSFALLNGAKEATWGSDGAYPENSMEGRRALV